MVDNPHLIPLVDSKLKTIAKSTFLAWERLRIVFVILLGLLTLIFSGPKLLQFRTLVLIAEGAIVANICYFAGPIIEICVRWIGYDRIWVRWFLFVSGMALTGILAVATLVSMFLPDQP